MLGRLPRRTGLREYSVSTSAGVEKSRSESGAYYALVVGDKFLIFKSGSGGDVSSVVEGRLVPWPSELESEMFDSKEMKALHEAILACYGGIAVIKGKEQKAGAVEERRREWQEKGGRA